MTDNNFLEPPEKPMPALAKKLPCPFSAAGMLQPSHLQPPPMFGPRGPTIPPKHMAPYAHFTIKRSQPRSAVSNKFNRPRDEVPRYHNRDDNTNSPKRFQRSREFWCEPCDRDFPSADMLQEHKSQHQKCGIDGCKFEGHAIIVNKHIQMQHSTGLYDRLKNLETPEDIKKWREERRKRYPTKANIELRQQMQEERAKRGEKLDNPKGRFGRHSDRRRCNTKSIGGSNPPDKTKEKKRKRRRPTKKIVSNQPEVKDHDEESVNNNGIPMFRGTSEMKNYKKRQDMQPKNALSLLGSYESDSESSQSCSDGSESEEEEEGEILKSASMSDNESIEERSSTGIENRVSNPDNTPEGIEKPSTICDTVEGNNEMDLDENDLEDLPSEEPIIKVEEIDDVITPPATSKVFKNNKTKRKVSDQRLSKRLTILDLSKKYRNQNTMLEKLLQNDIRHERNVLLQCVRHVVKENFFGIGQKPSTSGC